MSYSYIVSYGTSSTGPWTRAGTSSVASFTINGLSAGSNYWIQVIAVDTITGLQSSPSVAGPFQTGSVTQESPNQTVITSSSQTLYSSQTPGQTAPSGGPFDTWTITGQGGQVIHNGTTDTTTSSVQELFYQSHTVYHQESNGNSFGTPGWWQWTGTTTYPSATPGVGSFTDTRGNVWSLNVSGNPVVNGFTDTVSHAQIIYLIGAVVWQLDQTNNWYSLTPSGPITSGSLSWSGPTTTSPITGWVACASPSGVPLTITGISLSNNSVSSTAPSGTTVGAVSVGLSSGTFSGSLSLSGSNASSFSLSGSNLITAAGSLTAGNYSINLTATQSTASNSPFGPTPFTIISQASTGGPGPAAFSSFITADFSSAMNYPGGTSQQVVSQRMYGVYMGYGADATNRGGTNTNSFAAYSNSTFTNAMATANPGLHVVTGNTTFEATPFWTNDGSGNPTVVNPVAMSNLVNNFYKVDPLGISGILFGNNYFDPFTGNILYTPTVYGQMMGNLAAWWNNNGNGRLMPNGKPVPFIGCIGHNEPDSKPVSTTASYYSAMISAVKAVKSSYIVLGPVWSFYQGSNTKSFLQACSPQPDGVTWDAFNDSVGSSSPLGSAMYTNPTYAQEFSGGISDLYANQLPTGYSPTSVMLAGNVGYNGNRPDMWTVNGAMWMAVNQWNNLSVCKSPMWIALWDDGGQNYNGVIADNNGDGSSIQITPMAYYIGAGVRTVFGSRWNVPTNSAGLMVIACTPPGAHIGVMIINPGKGAQNGKTVALSHWPVNASGNGTANVWQMTSAVTAPGQDGTRSTIPVNNGVTGSNATWPNGLNFPDPSITIISV